MWTLEHLDCRTTTTTTLMHVLFRLPCLSLTFASRAAATLLHIARPSGSADGWHRRGGIQHGAVAVATDPIRQLANSMSIA